MFIPQFRPWYLRCSPQPTPFTHRAILITLPCSASRGTQPGSRNGCSWLLLWNSLQKTGKAGVGWGEHLLPQDQQAWGKVQRGVQFLHGLASWFISHSVELVLLLGQGTPESTGPEATLCLADPPSAVRTPCREANPSSSPAVQSLPLVGVGCSVCFSFPVPGRPTDNPGGAVP